MQKNESTVLRPWVLYHGALFGLENLFVYDNGSTDPAVIAELAKIETLGVTVDRSHTEQLDFANKGEVLGKRMKQLRDAGQHDLLIPLDCDEFFALEEAGGVVFDPAAIHAALRPLVTDTRLPQVLTNYLNVLGTIDEFWKAPYEKVFFQARGFLELEHGFHIGKSSLSTEHIETSFAYIHCHAKPFPMIVEHSRAKIAHWCNPDDPEALTALEAAKGIGWHLVKYLQITEAEYLALFRSELAIRVDGFSARLREVGADTDFLLGKLPRPPALAAPTLIPTCLGVSRREPDPGRREGVAIIVTGTLSPATGAVMRALASAGIDVGNDESFFMDPRWSKAISSGDRDALKRWLLVRAAARDPWAAWVPDIATLDAGAIAALRKPRIIHLLDQPRETRELSERFHGAGRALADAEMLASTGSPVLIIDPSLAGCEPFRLAEVLLDFCTIEPLPDRLAAMVPVLQLVRTALDVEGWIDSIRQDAVVGWCWMKGSQLAPTVELHVDGVKRAAGIANVPRPDLAAAGKSHGRFGYALPIGTLALPDRAIIDVVVAGSGHRLGNSRMTLAELRRRGG